MLNGAQRRISMRLEEARISIDGPQACDPKVLSRKFYNKVCWGGSLALGETYMDGLWECDALDDFFYRLLTADVEHCARFSLQELLSTARSCLVNLQTVRRAFQIAERHYDLGEDMFTLMLGPTMAYTCAYWKCATTLCDAQYAKFDLICRKLQLQKGESLLDIGCGWGTFAKYAAETYGVKVLGVTVSEQQAAFAQGLCSGLDVEIRVQDYRSVDERFDKISTVGMLEHVGAKNYRTYMQVVRRCLKEGGLSLLHTIGRLDTAQSLDPWIEKYIFPDGMLPSLKQITASAEGLFVIEDLHNFGADYDRTLLAWLQNFEEAWPRLKDSFGERFRRMWRYYLLSCAGAFRARNIQLWQLVFSENGVRDGYIPVR
jgi:cyclopropane-fatty-acyl-phospholipid synthase